MGTGAGWLYVMTCAAFAAWLVRACRRAIVAGAVVGTAANSKALGEWSTAGRFNVAAVCIKSAPTAWLTHEQREAVRRVALVELARCDSEIALAAIGGRVAEVGGGELGDGQAIVWDSARASAAARESRHVVAWAESLGVDLGNLGAGASERAATRCQVGERGKPCDMSRRAARFESLCIAFEAPHGVGTAAARKSRARGVSRLVSAQGSAQDYFARPCSMYRLGAPVVASGRVVARDGSASMPLVDLAILTMAAEVAEVRGRKWARGTHSSAKGAASKDEIGAAAGADDAADYHVRLTAEAVAIFRAVGIARAVRVVRRADRLGVVLGWEHVRRIAGHRRAGSIARREAEAWEYAACKGRDGREVGGDWAMQGSISGLADFALVRPGEGGDMPADDMGAGEWESMLDAAADRLGLSMPDDSATLSDDMRDALAEAGGAREVGGRLSFAPDSGAGSGRRPSIMGGLLAMSTGIRTAVESRIRSASSNQAKIAARTAGEVQTSLIDALRSWVADGVPLSPDLVAEYWPDGDTSAPLSSTARSKIKRLRDRSGLSLVMGPARAVEPRLASQVMP